MDAASCWKSKAPAIAARTGGRISGTTSGRWSTGSRHCRAPECRPYRPVAGAIQKDIVYSASPKLALDAFIPRSQAPVPAVIVVHGGGWEAGDKVTYVTPIFEPLARAGLAWFSIDYRLTPAFTHEDQLEDLREAIRFVRAEHKRFNIDPARIFLLGESASGQMVAQMATEDRVARGRDLVLRRLRLQRDGH